MTNIPVSPFDVDPAIAAGDAVSTFGAAGSAPVKVFDGGFAPGFATVEAARTYIEARNEFVRRVPITRVDVSEAVTLTDLDPVREIPLQVLCLARLARLDAGEFPLVAKWHAAVAVAACWRAGGGR